MDMSLSALYFVATVNQAVARLIALKAIDTRVTLNTAMAIAAQYEEGAADPADDDQTSAPAAEDDTAAPSLGDDDDRETDDTSNARRR